MPEDYYALFMATVMFILSPASKIGIMMGLFLSKYSPVVQGANIAMPPPSTIKLCLSHYCVLQTHRAVAYSSACRDVGKWLPVVTHNRKTSHLSFPLQEEAPPLPSLSSRVQDFQVYQHTSDWA